MRSRPILCNGNFVGSAICSPVADVRLDEPHEHGHVGVVIPAHQLGRVAQLEAAQAPEDAVREAHGPQLARQMERLVCPELLPNPLDEPIQPVLLAHVILAEGLNGALRTAQERSRACVKEDNGDCGLCSTRATGSKQTDLFRATSST